MAEKAFKVPSLGLVGTTAELDFASGDLRWNALPLATESYVDSAVSGVTVNVEALAGSGLTYTPTGGDLQVNPGTGLFIENDAVLVNTNAVAESLVGYGSGLYISDGDNINVNVNALAGSGAGFDTGLYNSVGLGGDSYLAVNTNTIATRAYVDAVAEGLHIHESVVAATTENINIASALVNGESIDGVTLATGDRVLVKNQNTGSQNGIYIVQASGGATVRANDYNTAGEIDAGDFFFVSGGTLYNNTGWVQTEVVTTLGSDGIVFVQFSGAGTYTAGNGLVLNGGEFSVNTNAIADSLAGDVTLYVSGGDNLVVNVNALVGWGLMESGGALAVNPGVGLYTDGPTVSVNTNVLATELAGTGLYVTSGDNLTVNTNAIADSLAGDVTLYVSDGDNLVINVNALVGWGLMESGGALAVNPGVGLYTDGPTVSVNTNVLATELAGTGLYVTSGDNLTVNTNAIITDIRNQLSTSSYGAANFYVQDNNGRSSVRAAYDYFTANNTYASVFMLDDSNTDAPEMIDIDVVMTVGGVTRSSKITGILSGTTAEYTEYGIVEHGGTIEGVDLRIQYVSFAFYLQAKANIDGAPNIDIVAKLATTGKVAS